LRIPEKIQRSERRHRSALAEHQGSETEEIGVGVLPCTPRQARLVANLLQKSCPIPSLFARHLRQQQALVAALADQQAVLPNADLLNVHHAAQRGQNRDLVMQVPQFARGDREETGVSERCVSRHLAHCEIQGLNRRHRPDATAQLSILSQSYERSALLRERLHPAGRALVSLALAHRGFNRLACDLEQRIFLRLSERKWRLIALGRAGGLHQSNRAVADHAAMIAGDIAGISVMKDSGLVGSQPLSGDHGGYDRSSAARLPNPQIQIAGQVEVIVLADGLQRLMIDSHRFVVRVIVREVGAGHNESVGSGDQLSQRHAERAAGIVTLISHNHRDKLELADHPLQKRQLVLDGVLRAFRGRRMSRPRKLDRWAHLREFRGESPVHRNLAERGRIGISVIHGRVIEGFVMRGCNHHHAVVFAALQECVRVRGNRT